MMNSRLAVFFAFLAICYGDDTTCTGRPDNCIAEIGCWGYDSCVGGKLVRNSCPPETVYDRDSHQCVQVGTNSTECGKATLCYGMADGNYADIGCKSYYVCYLGNNLGRIYCPSNLVFDPELSICIWPFMVLPPCGTKTPQL